MRKGPSGAGVILQIIQASAEKLSKVVRDYIAELGFDFKKVNSDWSSWS